jgi:hypothetical protein
MSIKPVRITGVEDVGAAMRAIAKKMNISVSALVDAGGTQNGSLISIATGRNPNRDMAIGPLLRVLKAVGYELVGRTIDEHGLVVKQEGAAEIRVTGADGGRLEVAMDTLADVPILLNTMAFANGLSMTGLVKLAGISSSSLVSMAKQSGPAGDLRLNNVLAVAATARFELIIRPVHRSAREARVALASAR